VTTEEESLYEDIFGLKSVNSNYENIEEGHFQLPLGNPSKVALDKVCCIRQGMLH